MPISIIGISVGTCDGIGRRVDVGTDPSSGTTAPSTSESSLASLFVAAYSYATTAADVRIWTSLPKEFQVARFPKPKDGKLKVKRPGSVLVDINIPDCNNAIVYVRITTDQAEPIFEVIDF